MRLRFSLERSCFDGLWEAIFDALGQRFLMLDNTITRRARQRNSLGIFANETGGLQAISSSDGTLNVLVIQSNVPDGSAPDGPDDLLWKQHWKSLDADLPSLPHLEEEVKVVRELRRARRGTTDAGKSQRQVKVDVLTLGASNKPWSLAERVEPEAEGSISPL